MVPCIVIIPILLPLISLMQPDEPVRIFSNCLYIDSREASDDTICIESITTSFLKFL